MRRQLGGGGHSFPSRRGWGFPRTQHGYVVRRFLPALRGPCPPKRAGLPHPCIPNHHGNYRPRSGRQPISFVAQNRLRKSSWQRSAARSVRHINLQRTHPPLSKKGLPVDPARSLDRRYENKEGRKKRKKIKIE
ncbi:hypothetical protein CGRA01v4_05035 [Colletotrichum graminicola]|nr:hypothetical protein CGRA01v4_05035 [Colletotrichum graminicola]